MLKSLRVYLFATSALVIYCCCWSVNASTNENFETVYTSNEAIFNRLGLSQLEISDGHHKKRLAGPEPPPSSSSSSSSLTSLQTRIHQPYNRRHGDHDSHVYFVKLPASPPYYTITKPHKKTINDDKVKSEINIDGKTSTIINNESSSVGFNSNGKTAKIYHWNLPLMKKVGEKKRLHALFKFNQMKKKLEYEKKNQIKLLKDDNNLKKILLNSNNINKNENLDKISLKKHARNNDKRLNYYSNDVKLVNELFDNKNNNNNNNNNINNDTQKKMLRLDDSAFYKITTNNINNEKILNVANIDAIKNIESIKSKKHRKKAASMSYYAPNAYKTGSTSIHNNFPGNGKPKAFYVMEKSRKPLYYHPLLP